MKIRFSRPALAVFAGTVTFAGAALAHHGWEWAEERHSNLEGTIREIYIGPPHPSLKVETAGDGLWTVDLANPRQTTNAGFVEGSARPGNKITVLGNRSAKTGEKIMKAVRITVDGKEFVLYPERLPKQ